MVFGAGRRAAVPSVLQVLICVLLAAVSFGAVYLALHRPSDVTGEAGSAASATPLSEPGAGAEGPGSSPVPGPGAGTGYPGPPTPTRPFTWVGSWRSHSSAATLTIDDGLRFTITTGAGERAEGVLTHVSETRASGKVTHSTGHETGHPRPIVMRHETIFDVVDVDGVGRFCGDVDPPSWCTLPGGNISALCDC
jgi:hypothetical protein